MEHLLYLYVNAGETDIPKLTINFNHLPKLQKCVIVGNCTLTGRADHLVSLELNRLDLESCPFQVFGTDTLQELVLNWCIVKSYTQPRLSKLRTLRVIGGPGMNLFSGDNLDRESLALEVLELNFETADTYAGGFGEDLNWDHLCLALQKSKSTLRELYIGDRGGSADGIIPAQVWTNILDLESLTNLRLGPNFCPTADQRNQSKASRLANLYSTVGQSSEWALNEEGLSYVCSHEHRVPKNKDPCCDLMMYWPASEI